MFTLFQDIKYISRIFHQNPGFSAISMMSPASAIGVNTAAFNLRGGSAKFRTVTFRMMIPLVIFLLFPSTILSCTSFGITEGKNIVVGNNDDWFSVSAYLVVNKRDITKKVFISSTTEPLEWTSKYGSITVNFNAIGIPSAGMNEAGLVIDELYPGVMPTYEPPDDRPTIDEIQWIQYQLDNCATVQEVVNTQKTIRIAPYYFHSHYFVYDRNGNAATIGFADGKMMSVIIPPNGIQVLANRPYPEALENFKTQSSTNNIQQTQSKRLSSADRFRIAALMAKEHANRNDAKSLVDYAFKILASTSQKTTAISWVYNPQNLCIHYKTIADGKIRKVAFDKFDFDGQTPMLLVDINIKKEGDISGNFEPYTLEKNRALVWASIKDWRAHNFAMHITDAEVERLIQYPESMKYTVRRTPQAKTQK